MRGALTVAVLMVSLGLAGCLTGDDAPDDEAGTGPGADPHEPDDREVSPLQVFEKYEQRPAGVEREMRILTEPFVIPPGQDLNRITVNLPLENGFLTAVSPNLIDVQTGETPTNQEMHIHHAHWFRASDDPEDEYYTANLAWIFGTGEERTQGSLHDRADADPDGPRYGIYIDQAEPQALIYMLHNKEAEARTMYVALEVRFVYGSAEAIAAASDCGDLQEGEACQAGEEFHNLHGKLWGSTFDVPRQPVEEGGDGLYVHPLDIPEDWESRRATDHLGRYYTASAGATAIAGAGHLHPSGMASIVANLGPEGSACEADLDSDGYPGVTLFHSDKIEEVPAAYPHSEEYQMGATKHGWRAPIHAGDRIAQFGLYANDEYAAYEAMSFVGLYTDRAAPPEPRGPEGCTLENTAPSLLEGDPWGGEPTETVINRAWDSEVPPHCGIPGFPECDVAVIDLPSGLATDTVHIAGFAYIPGDRALAADLGRPVQVEQGQPLTFVNEDAALGIRHSVTSCKWPCNGQYVANYPLPDGLFDSGKMGNLDPIDGGLVDQSDGPVMGYGLADDALPLWELDTDGLEPGMYAYYCRIHPWMRGMMEITESGEHALHGHH